MTKLKIKNNVQVVQKFSYTNNTWNHTILKPYPIVIH